MILIKPPWYITGVSLKLELIGRITIKRASEMKSSQSLFICSPSVCCFCNIVWLHAS